MRVNHGKFSQYIKYCKRCQNVFYSKFKKSKICEMCFKRVPYK